MEMMMSLLRRAKVFDIAAHRFIFRSLRNSKARPMSSKIKAVGRGRMKPSRLCPVEA